MVPDQIKSPHLLSDTPRLLAPIAVHYTAALRTYGAQPRGVFWRDTKGQRLRFEQLIGILNEDDWGRGLAINDLGCGYGAMFDFLAELPFMKEGRYQGYDITEEMVDCCCQRITDPRASFQQSLRATKTADYSFVSGTYNLRLDSPDDKWLDYIQRSLIDLATMSRKGLAFNMLAGDRSKRPRKTLYYVQPEPLYDFCLRAISPHVTLVTAYPLAEWTIWIRF
jgi:SAM-dependent methyltransferase